MELKTCIECNQQKPESKDFFSFRGKKAPGIYKNTCKKCEAHKSKEYRQKNLAHHQKIVNKRRENKTEKGICRRCSNPKLENILHCESCWYRRVASNGCKDVNFADFLKEMAEKQNFICPYTGEKLIIGINMSIDHIIPKYKNLAFLNKIDNFQFVATRINTVKNKLSHDEFLLLCKNICLKFDLLKVKGEDDYKFISLNIFNKPDMQEKSFKVCSHCKNKLDIHEFNASNRRSDKSQTNCKKCSKEISRQWKENQPDKYKVLMKNRRDSKKELKLCSNCPLSHLETCLLCEKCWYKRVSYAHFKTSEHWEFLKELAEKQNFECPYSNEKLIIGFNMSLDHIESKFDRSDLNNSINNVQWVLKDINTIKNYLSHDKFLQVCKVVCERFNLLDPL